MKIRRVLFALILAAIVASCGSGGGDHAAHDGSSTRTVDIAMHDIDFSLSALTVQRGETIKFVFQNSGALIHDAFIGDEAAQQEHEMEMSSTSSMGGMGDMGHSDHADGITVEPGQSGELTYTFNQSGTTYIGCHEAGHYAAGMKIRITVT